MKTSKIRTDVYKLSFIGTKYFINEKDKTVTAKVTVKFPNIVQTKDSSKGIELISCIKASIWKLKKSYIGTAKCNSNDNFDVEKGKKIARARADKSAYIDFKKFMNESERLFLDIFCKCHRTTNKAIDIIHKKKSFEKEITN